MRIRKRKGITLISLIITIIILIILAGVCINLFFSENGLIERIKTAKIEHEKALILEELEIEKAPFMIDEEGFVNIEKYLQAIDGKELNSGYRVSYINKIDENNAEIWIDGRYKYTATQIGTNVIINAEGYIENSKLEFDINIKGQEVQQNLPIVLTAQIDQTQTNNLLNINYVGYTVNSLKENIGTDKKNYIETILDENKQFQINIIEEGEYYVHCLCVDNEGNTLEIIKGPIKVSTKYHSHTGSSTTGDGCYTVVNYTYGKSSVRYYTVNWNKDDFGNYDYMYICNTCGTIVHQYSASIWSASGNTGAYREKEWYHTNCPGVVVSTSYSLGCEKDETTIEGYNVTYK